MRTTIRISKPEDVYPCLLQREDTGDIFLMTSETIGTRVHCPINPDLIGEHSEVWNHKGLSLFDDDLILNNKW